MRLSDHQLGQYRDRGFLVVEDMFSPDEVEILRVGFARDCVLPGPHVVMESGGLQVRSVYASHLRRPEFAALARLPRLLQPVRQLLEAEVYVYQFKINSKAPLGGEQWAWHQDYPAWRLADNLPAPHLVSVALLLDAVTEFNGPMIYVPGSHRDDMIRQRRESKNTSNHHIDPGDIALTRDQLASVVDRWGMVGPKGPAGTVTFFHPEVAHGSALNMSPYPRAVLIITYNDVTNSPSPTGSLRPEYLVGRDLTPLEPRDVSLLGLTQGAST
ncbi:MAG: phytanoyl-CoA dioxygenase family protein [Pseudonocardiaceae bacterium]